MMISDSGTEGRCFLGVDGDAAIIFAPTCLPLIHCLDGAPVVHSPLQLL